MSMYENYNIDYNNNMLLLTKNGLKMTDIKDLISVGINVHYLLFDTTELNIVHRVSGLSNAEIRRKIKAGAVWIGNDKVTDPNEIMEVGGVPFTVFIGKEFKGIVLINKVKQT